jgi:hypothetical protein
MVVLRPQPFPVRTAEHSVPSSQTGSTVLDLAASCCGGLTKVTTPNAYDCGPFSTFTVVVTWWPHDEHRNVRLSNPGAAGSMAASTATPPHFGHGILDAIGVVPEEDPTIIPKPLCLQSSGASKLSSVKRHKAHKTQYNGA